MLPGKLAWEIYSRVMNKLAAIDWEARALTGLI
jgi:hypothetical protein